MDNSSLKKIQKDLKKSNAVIIKSDDTSTHIKQNYGHKYLDDISDSDGDDGMSYKKRNADIINKLVEKNNTNIKPKMDGDSLSIKSVSIKKVPLRSTIKENIKILEELPQNKENNKKIDNNKKNNKKDDENNEKNSSDGENKENNEDEDEDEEEYEFREDFENQVKTYVKTDDKIKELQRDLKEMNQQKKVAEDLIMKHLERLGETNINITGGKLIVNKYGSKGSFKEDIVKEVLMEQIKDTRIVENIFEKIQGIREENAKIQMGLKRTSGKKK